MAKKLMRVSFSMLDAWDKGDWDRALAPFTGVEIEPTEPMQDGVRLHEEWEAETKKTGRLPAVFGGRKLDSPEVEGRTKRVITLPAPYDWIQLVGVLDLKHIENGLPTIEDYKRSTAKSSSEFANSFQHKTYQILYPEGKKFVYRVYNPITKEVTVSIVHLTKESLKEGIEFVITNASDMRQYLEANDISIERESHESKKK